MPLTISRPERALLAATMAAYLLVGLGAYGLLDNNEGLYAEMAREMVEDRSFVVPQLNGVPYLEKPPLLAWLVAGAYAGLGRSELVSRLVPVAATVLLLAGLVAFGRSLQRPALGWLAATVLATSGVFALTARTLFPDGLLTALFGGAVMLFHAWHRRRRRVLLVASYALIGLAVLAKGFLALALGAAVFAAFGALRGGVRAVRALLDPLAVAALLAIVAPWHVALALADGDFAWFYFVNEHVMRYLGLREPHDYYTGPAWYYLPRIPMYALPWCAFFALLPLRRRGLREEDGDLERLLWIWFWAALVFFSLSEAKANYYMVLGMPALALLVADRLEWLALANRRRAAALCALAVACAAMLGFALAQFGTWTPHRGIWWLVLKRREELALALLGLGAMSGIAAALFASASHRLGVLAMALAGLPLLVFAVGTAASADRYVSSREIARYVDARYPGRRVLVYADYERLSSLPYYLARRVGVVDSRSNDLAFGMRFRRDPGRFVACDRARALVSSGDAVLLVHRTRLKEFRHCFGGTAPHATVRIGNVSVYDGDTVGR